MQDLIAALAEASIAAPHSDPAAIDDAQWAGVCARVLTPEHLQLRFSFPNPAMAARLAALVPHLAAQHLWALRQPGATHNPYVTNARGVFDRQPHPLIRAGASIRSVGSADSGQPATHLLLNRDDAVGSTWAGRFTVCGVPCRPTLDNPCHAQVAY